MSISDELTTNTTLINEAVKLKIPLKFIGFDEDLKNHKRVEGGYIINLGDDEIGGTHWVALWIELYKHKSYAVYFDSFGFPPSTKVIEYTQNIDVQIYSNSHIQDEQKGGCGSYVIEFLEYMTHKMKGNTPEKRFKKFTDLFSRIPEHNRRILRSMEGIYPH